MIKAKRNKLFSRFFAFILNQVFAKKFNKIIVNEIPIRENHSVLLLCNHFSIESDSNLEIVLTVPAYFDDHQRTILKECCESIGLLVLVNSW